MDNLRRLAELIRQRNAAEIEITGLTGRPAAIGHLGEYIAAGVFGITLVDSASHKSIDGYFTAGPLAGRSVNVKWYARQEGLLDITPDSLPDFYLVMTGPKTAATSSRGKTRPWTIELVYLFEARPLVVQLRQYGMKIGIATSVRQSLWQAAEIYPVQRNNLLFLSDEKRQKLFLFYA